MDDFTHGFEIVEDQCRGKLACLRACPTHAIRVRNGKASLKPEFCIDCGVCFSVCPSGAIRPTTLTFADIHKYKFKVAVPSPVLFAQFPMAVSIEDIVRGLLSLGFDSVWNYSTELALVDRGIKEYLENWKGPYPLISITCPVVVRLVQVLYPGIVDQLIHVQPARELAGRVLKRKLSEELGIDSGDIAAIYISPCQAKTISILKPAEGSESSLDGAIGISDVYNHILADRLARKKEKPKDLSDNLIPDAGILNWATTNRHGRYLSLHQYLSVTGLRYIIQVFDDIEKGRLRNIEYLECYSCWDGCVGGNLTVDNIYTARSKIRRLLEELPDSDPELEAAVKRRFPHEDFSLNRRIKPRTLGEKVSSLEAGVKRMGFEKAVKMNLPGIDCGLCGAPTCDEFAKDLSWGRANQKDCIFFSDKSLRELRKLYRAKSQ